VTRPLSREVSQTVAPGCKRETTPHPDDPMRRRSTHPRYVLLIVLLAFIGGCFEATAPQSSILAADSRDDGVELRNLTGTPVYWLAIETDLLASSNYAICTDPRRCTPLPAHASRTVTLEELFCCQSPRRHYTIFHYHLVPELGGGFRPDMLRQVGVQL
jgi:hypothetical protein